ncbi:MAG TPA: zinc transporter ZupT [Bacteroidales bacterium]|jgi:ZIP family zinc transporter|nr:zinc transporter ZupT [Bacteroidales bacterium]
MVLFAFALTLFAGLSTGIGSAIALFARRTNTTFLTVALGFSTGVMLYVSFVELLAGAFDTLGELHGEKLGGLYAILAFFGGVMLILIIDRLIPHDENPHEMKSVEEIAELGKTKRNTQRKTKEQDSKLLRTGLMTALVLAIHNFPEGMATFLAALKDVHIAIPIAVAIAIHNIPEGIAVSVPIYYATGDRKRAFWLSFLSGLAEPLGALVGYLILAPFLNDTLFGIMFAAIAGIMVFISLDELLPAAREYGKHHHAIYGLIAGMAVMAFSLLLLG